MTPACRPGIITPMPRMPRLVVPGLPHHVTQRGVRSTDIFRDEADRFAYLDCLRLERDRWGVEFLAWCLMTNHVHLVVVPRREDSLARGIGEAHKRYTRGVNLRDGVRGHMFQGRFGSCVLDERHLATGRPLGGEGFVRGLEKRTGRRLVPRKGGWPKGRKRRRRGN